MFVLPLLLAVTTITVQDSTPPAPRTHRARRAPVAVSAMTLQAAAATLAASRVDLEMFATQAPVLAASAAQLEQAAMALPTLALPPEPWAQQDPADSLYRAARRALNRNQYDRAAELFASIQQRYPRSTYTADSFYW
jgi:TolA-binding protein